MNVLDKHVSKIIFFLVSMILVLWTGGVCAQAVQQGPKLFANGAVGNAAQGVRVALSGDGNTAIIGGSVDNGNAGAAWIFTRSAGLWTQQGSKLVGAGAQGSARQGSSVALSFDGNTAIVGGPFDNGEAGAVWIFTRSAGVWTQQGGKLVGNDAVGSARQGSSVALSGDGKTALVGGFFDNGNAGAAWIFSLSGGVWTQQGSKLVGAGAQGSARQGVSVALSSDGTTAIMGGYLDNSNTGAAWVFIRPAGVWIQQGQKLVGTGTVGFAAQGSSVSLSGDGNTAIIGGPSDNGNAGAAWVFTRSAGVWSQQGSKLVGTGAVGSANQGQSSALSVDGNTSIVGAPSDNGNAGAAWVFTRKAGVWSQQGSKFVGTGAAGSARQGDGVALSADGTTGIVGGPSDNSGAGATWVFTKNSANISLSLMLTDGGANTTTTRGSTGVVQAGYAVLNVNSGGAPYGTAVFSFSENGVVVSEAGVPASPPTTHGSIFIDFRTGVSAKGNHAGSGTVNIDTGMALVNRTASTANVIFTLGNQNGQTITSGTGTLPAGAHRAMFIDQLSSLASGFTLPANFATSIRFATLDILSDQPISILAIRLTGNQRGDTLLTSTPIADLSQTTSTDPIYFPQVADGSGYQTTIVLLNTSATAETGNLLLLKDDGSPLTATPVGGVSGSSFLYSIAAGGYFVLQTDGSAATVNTGSAQVVPSGGTATPVGAGVFALTQNGIDVTESGVPSARPTTHACLYIDLSNQHDTGIALANPSNRSLTATLTAYQADRVTAAGNGPATVTLQANSHTAAFVDQLIAGLPAGFTGVLDLSSSSPVVALTLRSLLNTRGDFLLTTFPIADFTRPAPTPIVFPQIADGGGFQTQFILLSTGGAATTTLDFYGENGEALGIGKREVNGEK